MGQWCGGVLTGGHDAGNRRRSESCSYRKGTCVRARKTCIFASGESLGRDREREREGESCGGWEEMEEKKARREERSRVERLRALLIMEQLVPGFVDFVQCRYAPLHRNEQRKAVQQRHRVDHQRRQYLRSSSAAANTTDRQLSATHECNIITSPSRDSHSNRHG